LTLSCPRVGTPALSIVRLSPNENRERGEIDRRKVMQQLLQTKEVPGGFGGDGRVAALSQ
jgi:hypothetical protein